jgi:L-2-hydroxyglutarate oxidase LhgO
LGIHATIDLDGYVRFGPNVEWLKQPFSVTNKHNNDVDFSVNESHETKQVFYEEIKKYWPAIDFEDLVPDYAGIRPKLFCEDDDDETKKKYSDFRIDGLAVHGIKDLCCLYGIESPGLTSSLAIGEFVKNIMIKQN